MTKPSHTPHTLDFWQRMAGFYTAAMTREQVEAVAAEAYRADLAGQPCGVWHAASVVTNTVESCYCAPCCKARGEQPVRF